jgi:hypothetical protein
MSEHPLTICERDGPGDYRGPIVGSRGGGWTFPYKCPVCGRSGKFHANLLGKRKVVCNGVKFSRQVMDLRLALAEHGREAAVRHC